MICSIDEVLKNVPFSTARALAKITGKIISMSPIIGNISRLMTRSLYLTIEGRLSWDNPLDLRNNVNIFEGLKFWRDNVKYLNVRKLLVRLPPRFLAYSDASNDACGAFVSCDNIISHKMWSSEERSMSSTWREMKAIYYSLLSFLPLLKGQNIHWFSDNQSTISVINHGSMKVHLQKLALDIFSLCLNNNISIYLEWTPRNLNEIADAISKFIDYDDWRTTDGFFYFRKYSMGTPLQLVVLLRKRIKSYKGLILCLDSRNRKG